MCTEAGNIFINNSLNVSEKQPYYLNITNLMPIKHAQILNGYLMPFILVITIIANTLILLVLSKRHMRTPTNILLMSMALSDMFTLLIPSPWLFYAYTFDHHAQPLYPLAACYAFRIMYEIIPNLFHTASIWLTLALALQRYIYICHPILARTWCTSQGINKVVFWIFLLAGLHQAAQPFASIYVSRDIAWGGRMVTVCEEIYSSWLCTITPNVYFSLYYWFRVIFVHVIPCTFLVFLNVLLCIALKRADLKKRKLLKDKKDRNEFKKLRDSNMTTLMLIVVVTVFLCVEIPLGVVTILHIINNSMFEVLNYDIAQALILFTNFFIIVSYPVNFAIYCGMSREFRKTFTELFLRRNNNDKSFNSNATYAKVNMSTSKYVGPDANAGILETNL